MVVSIRPQILYDQNSVTNSNETSQIAACDDAFCELVPMVAN